MGLAILMMLLYFQVKSDSLEKSFLSGKDEVTFRTDEFEYKVNFKEIPQENTDPNYLTKRSIKRRPSVKPTNR